MMTDDPLNQEGSSHGRQLIALSLIGLNVNSQFSISFKAFHN